MYDCVLLEAYNIEELETMISQQFASLEDSFGKFELIDVKYNAIARNNFNYYSAAIIYKN